jgi:hypothetical protein
MKAKICFAAFFLFVVALTAYGKPESTEYPVVLACTINGNMQLLVLQPSVHPASNDKTERVFLNVPTRPVKQLKRYWDTAVDASGKSWQMLFLQSETDGVSGMKFGRQGYHGVSLNDKPVEVMAFQQNGELWTFVIDGVLYEDIGGKAVIIGAAEFRSYKSQTGEPRRAFMSKRTGNDGKWCFEEEGKVFEQGSDLKITQIGWMEWRAVTLSGGGTILVIMTKGWEKDAKWVGKHDGKLYVEKS